MSQIVHDGALWISIGRNRKDKSWKQKELQWSDLVERLQKPRQTDETIKEYLKFSKDIQAEKKDVGGFVGGPITGGRRKKGTVGTRTLITLDIDYAYDGFWDVFPLFYDSAAFLYATHSHTPDKPRLRLVMPLSREILSDEYEPVARRIAGDLGINHFDDSTYQPERLMYWPSTPKDVTYYWAFQDGPWVDPDELLARYYNWKDSSQWPLSDRAKAMPKRLAKQAGEPHDKPGIIGAFNRAYTIQEAIEEYLSDVYEASDDDNRYTFIEGTAAKGLVIYDDKFAYSHHGTDPISGRLCNAFDLVRIHLYGAQDETSAADTAINKLPSYGEMKRLAVKDKLVKKEAATSKLSEASEAFAELDEEDQEWAGALNVDGNSNILSTAENVLLILANDPELKGCFAYNAFEARPMAMRDLPWRSIKKQGEPLIDEDDACLRNHLERNYGISSSTKIEDALKQHLVMNTYHPVRDYLGSLKWDGTERVDTLLIDYFGAEDSEYTREVMRKTMLAAVARVMQPGIKKDEVLVLISEEGKYKSTFLNKLGRQWFSSDFGPLNDLKTAMEQLQGSWIIEIAELDAFKKAEMSTIKHFVSKPEDRFRKAFGKRMGYYPRQCIFIGTSNEWEFLIEQGMHRRFWPVVLSITEPERDVWDDLTPGEVRQIWAETVEIWKSKESLRLSKEVQAEARRIVQEHIAIDDRQGVILEYIGRLVPEEWENMSTQDRIEFMDDSLGKKKGEVKMQKVSAMQIWVELFGKRQSDANRWSTKFITDILNAQKGWEKKMIRTNNYGLQKGYVWSEKSVKNK